MQSQEATARKRLQNLQRCTTHYVGATAEFKTRQNRPYENPTN
jgi:hypothetical protein